MYIIKRNGSQVEFDNSKIFNAIKKANSEVIDKEKLTDEEIHEIVDTITKKCESLTYSLSVEEVQDSVEDSIYEKKKFVLGRAYSQYRFQRALQRQKNTFDSEILSLVSYENETVKQENSNKKPEIVSVQRDYMAGYVSKDISRKYLIPEDVMKAHDEGIIHFHDSDYFANKLANCCLVNLEDMLQNGTVLSNVMIEKPHSFSTACTIATQIMAQIASGQYGGQSMSIAHLSAFVQVSREKIQKELKEEWDLHGQDYTSEKNKKHFDEIVEKRVDIEIAKGVQTIQYQVLNMQTTNGQAPFITLFMYINEVPEGQAREDHVRVIEEVIKQRIQGVKNEKGVWITPAFPKLIYVLDENNTYQGSKYFWLTRYACECISRRMVPDFISAKIQRQLKDGNVYPCMGCVDGSSVIDYKFKGEKYVESFKDAWERLSKEYDVLYQPNGKDLYMDTDGVEIFDCERLEYVKQYRIIRNTQESWYHLDIRTFVGDTKYTRSLDVTNNHPLDIKGKGVIFAEELEVGDIIDASNGIFEIREISSYYDKKYSYDVTTESEHFMVNGIYSHNCRSFLTSEKDIRNPDGTQKFYGRFNQGVVTINLPDVALSSGKDFDKFWDIFEERLELCHKALRVRHERLLGTLSDSVPIVWQNGGYARLKRGEKIDKLLYGGYSTISLGYAGLYECVKYMTGKSHTDEEAKPFALAVMQKLNDKCNEWREKENIAYSVYGTPIESTTYKFAKCLKKRFGVIEGVTDKNYITNSYHVVVTEHINAFDKISLESEFQKLSPGGAISYVEAPDLKNNVEAIVEIAQHIYENILYAEINIKSDYCMECGYDGEIKIIEDEHKKLIWECPNCGNRDQAKMNVARRTCGYIGSDFWNQGRTQEIKERVLHVDNTVYEEES